MEAEGLALRMKEFDAKIKQRLETQDHDIQQQYIDQPDWNRLALDEDDAEFDQEFSRVANDDNIKEADDEAKEQGNDYTTEVFDNYLNMEVGMPR